MTEKRFDKLVDEEIKRQNEKWQFQEHSHYVWFMILIEEIGEIAKAYLESKNDSELKEELIQCAAVIKQWTTRNFEGG